MGRRSDDNNDSYQDWIRWSDSGGKKRTGSETRGDDGTSFKELKKKNKKKGL